MLQFSALGTELRHWHRFNRCTQVLLTVGQLVADVVLLGGDSPAEIRCDVIICLDGGRTHGKISVVPKHVQPFWLHTKPCKVCEARRHPRWRRRRWRCACFLVCRIVSAARQAFTTLRTVLGLLLRARRQTANSRRFARLADRGCGAAVGASE